MNELSTNTNNIAFYQYRMPRKAVFSVEADTAIARFTSVLVTPAANGFSGTKQLIASLNSGLHSVSVSSAELGSFTLRTRVDDLRSCPAATAKLGEEIQGRLDLTGCRWLDQFVPSDDPTPISFYRFEVESRTIVQLDEASKAFDATVLLARGAEELQLLAANDDAAADTTDSRILINLTPGSYVAIASAFEEDVPGDFTLKLGGEPPRTCTPQTLTSGAALDGQVPSEGCRVLDYISFSTLADLTAPFRRSPAS